MWLLVSKLYLLQQAWLDLITCTRINYSFIINYLFIMDTNVHKYELNEHSFIHTCIHTCMYVIIAGGRPLCGQRLELVGTCGAADVQVLMYYLLSASDNSKLGFPRWIFPAVSSYIHTYMYMYVHIYIIMNVYRNVVSQKHIRCVAT